MRYRKLGATRIKVSEIGFGTWGLGGVAYGPVDDKESLRALAAAMDAGINFFDTADLYGSGHSERITGTAIQGKRDKVVISSKAGATFRDGARQTSHCFDPNYLRLALEKSLRRLQTDYIDVYHLHGPDVKSSPECHSAVLSMEQFKKEGLIREYAISLKSPDCGIDAIGVYQTPVIQVNFNLLDQRAIANGLFKLCRKSRTGVIVRTPLTFGFLAGFGKDANPSFARRDHRKDWSLKQRREWRAGFEMFEFLAGESTMAQACLRFCLDFSECSTVIPGMLTVNQVLENVRASSLPSLTAAQHNKIRKTYRKSSFNNENGESVTRPCKRGTDH